MQRDRGLSFIRTACSWKCPRSTLVPLLYHCIPAMPPMPVFAFLCLKTWLLEADSAYLGFCLKCWRRCSSQPSADRNLVYEYPGSFLPWGAQQLVLPGLTIYLSFLANSPSLSHFITSSLVFSSLSKETTYTEILGGGRWGLGGGRGEVGVGQCFCRAHVGCSICWMDEWLAGSGAGWME